MSLPMFVKQFLFMWRWVIVGVTTKIIDYLIFICTYSLIESVLITNLFAGISSSTFNYLAHFFWSFRGENSYGGSGRKYIIILVIFWCLGTLALKGLITAGIDPKIAKLIPIAFFAPLSFLSLKFFVFKKKLN